MATKKFKSDISKLTKRFENAPTNEADLALIDANLQSGRQRKLELQDQRGLHLHNGNSYLERDSFNGNGEPYMRDKGMGRGFSFEQKKTTGPALSISDHDPHMMQGRSNLQDDV